MSRTVAELAEFLGARLEIAGANDVAITGVAAIETAQTGQLSFIANSRYLSHLQNTKASAVLISAADHLNLKATVGTAILVHENPYSAFCHAIGLFHPAPPSPTPGVDRSAQIGHKVSLGDRVHVGPHCVIEDGVVLGEGTIILAGSFVGRDTTLGADCQIGPNTTIMHECTLGARIRIHPGAVIGADGFGFTPVEGVHEKIPQVGGVTIGDDVEIGACCTIDRAALDQTVIGRGTKIDNLVIVAHNVRIGEDCIIISQTGIAGSATLRNNVTIAAQSGIVGHIEIGDGAIVMARSGIRKSIPPGAIYFGSPAREAGLQRRIFITETKLPEHIKTIRRLEKRIAVLEDKSKKSDSSD